MFKIYITENKILAIVILITIASILLGIVNCTDKRHQDNKSPVGINLIFSYPVVQVIDNKVVFYKLTDTIAIVYYKNYVLYQLPKARILETDRKIQNDDTYFLSQRDSSYGVLFKPTNMNSNKRVSVDSFLKERAFAGIKLENGPNDTLNETIDNDRILVEKYIPKQNGQAYFDSLFFSYSKDFELIDFSFSKKMDSLKQMKLFKVRLINNEGFSSQYNRVLPKREYFFELNEIIMDSLKNYVQIIENFKNKSQ